jgi:hypothetical protein
MRWLRLDICWDDSPWLFVLSEGAQLAWVKLLCTVKRDGSKGRMKAIRPLVASRKWGVGEESVVKMLQAAQDDGALSVEDAAETWVITNWDRYQEPDSTAAERMRRMREKPALLRPVTPCYAVTPVTGGVTRHATETETLDRDKKGTPPSRVPPLSVPAGFAKEWDEYMAMRKRVNHKPWKDPKTAPRWIATLSEHPDPVGVLRYSIDNEYRGLFPDRVGPKRGASEPDAVLHRTKPKHGLDFDLRMVGDVARYFIPGTDEAFDEDAWRESRAGCAR